MEGQVLEFKRKVFAFRLDGQEYKVNHPNLKQIEELQKKGDEPSIDSVLDFLQTLGLERTVSEGMQPDHLKTIVDHLVGDEKKS